MAETSRTTSHLSQIRKWWKHLSDENFVALDPPTSGRYTQSDLHEDATEEIHDRELPIETSYAGWHWQSHKRAFNKKGELLEPLIFHWGGDRETVREHLQNTPEGWTLSGGESDTRAFQLDLVAPRELPKFDDRNGTYRVLDRLTDRQREQPDDPIPADTEAWMHDLLAHVLNTPDFDSEIVEELLRNMSMAQLFTTEELDALTADTCTIAADTYVLEGLLHVQHPKSAEYARRIGEPPGWVLRYYPNPITLGILAEMAPNSHAVLDDYIEVRAQVEHLDIVDAALRTIDEMPRDSWTPLRRRVVMHAVSSWYSDQLGQPQAGRWELGSFTAITEERLPIEFRSEIARETREMLDAVDAAPQAAPLPKDKWEDAAQKARAVLPELLANTPPMLNGDVWTLDKYFEEFTHVDQTHENWLREALNLPDRTFDAYEFILGTLVDHNLGTVEDIETCSKLWRKSFTKKGRQYGGRFRHPMVSLTDLCIRLEHPLLDKLVTWWNKPSPKWKDEHKPVVELLLDPPKSPAEAVARFRDVPYGPAAEQFFTQYILLRARAQETDPRDEALELVHAPEFQALRPGELVGTSKENILLSVVVPEQPLWNPLERPALDRALRVLEDPDSSAEFREATEPTLMGPRVVRDYNPEDLNTMVHWRIPLTVRRQRALEKLGK